MSDAITDRVAGILDDAERGSDDLGALDDLDDLPGALEESGLAETAEEASALIEEDTDEVLAALGLDELEDGTEPDSLPEAIALGGEERIGDLRVLVKLAKIAGADEDDLDAEIGDLREVLDERVGSEDEAEEADGDEGESLAESAADAVQNAVSGDDGAGEDGEEEGLIERELESAIRSKLEGAGEEVDEARARLDSLRGEEGEPDEAEVDEAEVDEADREADEDAEDAADDGPLGSESRPRSRGTMHSTMAPSPSRRADMGRSTRHSTMPDR